MMVGGGATGKEAGIVHGNTIRAGINIEVSPPFINVYQEDGEMTTGQVDGKVANGKLNHCIMRRFKETGGLGKITAIGKTTGIGVSRGITIKIYFSILFGGTSAWASEHSPM